MCGWTFLPLASPVTPGCVMMSSRPPAATAMTGSPAAIACRHAKHLSAPFSTLCNISIHTSHTNIE
jgi:hypothetical protein